MYKLYKHVHVDVLVLHGRLIHPMYKLYPQSMYMSMYMYYMEDSSTQCISYIHRACACRCTCTTWKTHPPNVLVISTECVHVDVHVLHGRLIHPMYKLYPQSVCMSMFMYYMEDSSTQCVSCISMYMSMYMYYMGDSSTQCISCIHRACGYTGYCGRQKQPASTHPYCW